jgi:hypothetical protein
MKKQRSYRLIGFLIMFIISMIIFSRVDAKNLVSPNGSDVFEAQEKEPVETFNPFQVQPFYLNVDVYEAYLTCTPLDPRGVYVCRWIKTEPE